MVLIMAFSRNEASLPKRRHGYFEFKFFGEFKGMNCEKSENCKNDKNLGFLKIKIVKHIVLYQNHFFFIRIPISFIPCYRKTHSLFGIPNEKEKSIKNFGNSRCCCNETLVTAGRNLDYCYLYFIQEIRNVVFRKILSCSDTWHTPVQFTQHMLALLL